MAANVTSDDPKKKTPKKRKDPADARSAKNAGKYPNQWTQRTRSGHVLSFDDSEGAESITLQHRGGSMIQFKPDGAVHFVSHNGQYNMVFGENRIKITGAYDITVEGGGSLKVDGDYNVTVKGDANYAIGKDFNLVAKNFTQKIRENVDVVSGNMSLNAEGNIDVQSTGGFLKMTADKSLSIQSKIDSVGIRAEKQLGLVSNNDKLMLQSKAKMSLLSDNEIALDSAKTLSLKSAADIQQEASGGDVRIQGGEKVYLNSGANPSEADSAKEETKVNFPSPGHGGYSTEINGK